jgi:hypothetical protein
MIRQNGNDARITYYQGKTYRVFRGKVTSHISVRQGRANVVRICAQPHLTYWTHTGWQDWLAIWRERAA